jgi:hypothetical protein
MTKKIFSATAVLIGAGSLLMGCSFEQPNAGCIVQDSPSWQAFYELDTSSVTPACADSTAAKNPGELLGVFKFVDPNNLSDIKLVVRPNGLASRAVRDQGSPYEQNAVGKMTSTPDAENFCTASEFSAAKVNDPGVTNPTTGVQTTAPTQISYQFENMRVLAAPNAPGTQARGDLTYTRDGCTAKYKVLAIWPRVACDPEEAKKAEPNPVHNCGEGSGANPDFNLVCHPTLKYCMPDVSKPVFKTE